MSHNPYTSPTNLDHDEDTRLTSKKVKRPISIWLMQTFLFIFVGMFVIGFFRTVRSMAVHWSPATELWRFPLILSLNLALIALFLWIIFALGRRRNWAKWVSIAFLVLLTIFAVTRPDTTQYLNDAERTGGFIGQYLFFPALFTWWAYALVFSAKSKRYFASSEAN